MQVNREINSVIEAMKRCHLAIGILISSGHMNTVASGELLRESENMSNRLLEFNRQAKQEEVQGETVKKHELHQLQRGVR